MIDKVPAPPTDNLYKMLTGIGLILLTVGMIGPPYVTRATGDRLTDLWRQQAVEYGETWAALLAEAEKTRSDKLQTRAIDSICRKADMQGELLTHTVKALNTDLDFYYRSFDRVFWMGLISTTFGAAHWWYRHQRYQDRLAASDSERAALEVEKLKLELTKMRKVAEHPVSQSPPAASTVSGPPAPSSDNSNRAE